MDGLRGGQLGASTFRIPLKIRIINAFVSNYTPVMIGFDLRLLQYMYVQFLMMISKFKEIDLRNAHWIAFNYLLILSHF